MDTQNGERRHVLLTVIRWKAESIENDTAYSLESIEVKEEAADALAGVEPATPTALAAGEGDAGTLVRFKTGIKQEHQWRNRRQGVWLEPRNPFSLLDLN
jgi:hypothetical protein